MCAARTIAVYFLSDAGQPKDAEIKQYTKVCLAFADTGGQKYVSLAGHAEVTNDRAKIHELWGTPAKAWWNSPDDPNIRVLKVPTAGFDGSVARFYRHPLF
jgi:general stress protein 26